MPKIGITETVLRDGHQSLIATRQLGFSEGQFGLLMFLIGIAALIGTGCFPVVCVCA